MPNWVKNNVRFGTDKVLKECLDEKGHFDFNKVIPMPEVLKDENGLDKLTQEERLLFLKDNDGCDNWYDWSIRNWGCKWNANETIKIDNKTVSFQTPWSMPDPIFLEISRKYKTTVVVEYGDECIAENSGRVEYYDGEEMCYIEGDGEYVDKVWEVNEPDEGFSWKEGGDM